MSSRTETQQLLALFAALADGVHRQERARHLAQALGAEELLVFVPDPETAALLPALGMIQTLPQGRVWQRFLSRCLEEGIAQATLPFPDGETLTQVVGLAGEQRTVLVLLGGTPHLEDARLLLVLLPLLDAAFRREQALLVAEAQKILAQTVASEAQQVVSVLERTRAELEHELLRRTQAEASLQQQIQLANLQREQLQASEARFRLLAEQIPQKIFTALPTGDVDYFNPQWTQFTGLSFEEIRAWGWTQFIHPDDLEENLRRWREALATGEPFYCEHRFRRADGVYRWHVSRAVPLRDEAGKIVMWLGSNTDIEEQKQLEERKDEFLRMVSHDLRSPLTAMKGNLQLARRQLSRWLSSATETSTVPQGAVEELARLIERALRQADIQNRLISDLLDVSRIQAGKLELSRASCDLTAVVQQIVQDYQATMRERSISLLLPPEPVQVWADADRLRQVLSNYLTNAFKYTPASSPIEVGISVQDQQARVWVRDHGPGLTPQQQQRIWERYYQVEGITPQRGVSQGLGLGLHICRALITQHGGTVGVESIPGQGATFWFTLPLDTSDDRTEQ